MFFLPASTYAIGFAILFLYGLVDAWWMAIQCKDPQVKESHTVKNARLLWVFAKTMGMGFINAFAWPILFVLLCPEIFRKLVAVGRRFFESFLVPALVRVASFCRRRRRSR